MNEDATRRALLTAFAVSSTAGCLDRIPFMEDESIRLSEIWLSNNSGKEQTFDLTLRRNDDVVFEGSIELSDDEFDVIEPTWPAAPAEYTITYGIKYDGPFSLDLSPGDALSMDEADREDHECYYLQVYVPHHHRRKQ